jgi:exosortase
LAAASRKVGRGLPFAQCLATANVLQFSASIDPDRRLDVMTSFARIRSVLGIAPVLAVVAWAYWPTLAAMADKWSSDAQYSHGFLVPAFAVFLLWHRRRLIPSTDVGARARVLGLLLVVAAVALHLVSAYYFFDALGMISLLPLLAGICCCWGGAPALRWAWPAIGFLVFMLPLPYRVEGALSHPLQRLATVCSTYVLQTLGFAAVSEGNVIILDNARIGVVEACNGLGMLVTFFAMTTAAVLVIRRHWLEKLLLIPTAIPIAVIANVIRITVTGMLHALVGTEIADRVFHDLAGWLMMPLAVVLLWLEIRLLGLLLQDPEPDGVPVIGLGVPVTPAARLEPVGAGKAI